MSNPYGSMLLWIAVLILIVLAGGFAIDRIRRRMFEEDKSGDDLELTLDGLRKLRDTEMINEEEYENLRAAMLASMGYEQGGLGENQGGTEADRGE